MSRRAFWRVQLGLWAVYAVVHYMAALPAITPDERWHMAGIKAVRALAGFLVSSPIPLLFGRPLRRGWGPAALVTMAAVVALVLGNLWLIVDRILLAFVRSLTPLQVNWLRFPHGFDLDYAFVLLAWMAGYVALWHWNEAARRREEALEHAMAARDARLQALTHQLSPHFLFNTLNALRGVIAEDQERAREMVTRLAAFLRQNLSVATETTIADEIAMTRAYLGIEQARFERALQAEVSVEPATERAVVPSLLLQPLVENALKHGRADASGIRRVSIHVREAGRGVTLEVANTGVLGSGADTGIGIGNTRARIAHAFGDRARLRLVQDGEWTRATVEIEEPRRQ